MHTASASAIVGFPSRSEIEAPSISTQVLPFNNVRQWIFPSMVFNCTGNITRWIFRAEETGNNNERVPRMSTWRSNPFTTTTTDFSRTSQSGSAEELTGNGPVYEYVLQEPVEIQEGDFLGFDLSPEGDEELQFVFQNFGVGNAPDSYARTIAGSNFNTAAQLITRNQQYLPLITVVIGEYAHVAIVTDKVVYAQSNLQQVLQMVVQHQWSSPPPPCHPPLYQHSHNNYKQHLHRQVW